MGEREYVEVVVRVPKSVVDFVEVYCGGINEYIEDSLPQWVGADIDAGVFDETLGESLKSVVEKTGIRAVVDKCYFLWMRWLSSNRVISKGAEVGY